MCWRPLAKRQPSQLAQPVASYGHSKRLDWMAPWDGDVDAADRVDQLLESLEVDDRHVVDRNAGVALDRSDRERSAAHLVRGVDPVGSVSRDLHPEVARDREVVDAMEVGVRAHEHHRVRVAQPPPGLARRRVGAEQEDRGRLREHEAVLARELPLQPRETGACSPPSRRHGTRSSRRGSTRPPRAGRRRRRCRPSAAPAAREGVSEPCAWAAPPAAGGRSLASGERGWAASAPGAPRGKRGTACLRGPCGALW